MKVWDEKWLERLRELQIRVEDAVRYMDDGRAIMYRFKPGWRWFNNSVKYCERWRMEDEGKTGLEITKNILS